MKIQVVMINTRIPDKKTIISFEITIRFTMTNYVE